MVVGPLVTLALFLALWEYMHRDGMRRFFDKPGFLVPSPVTVIDQSFLDSVVREPDDHRPRLDGGVGVRRPGHRHRRSASRSPC